MTTWGMIFLPWEDLTGLYCLFVGLFVFNCFSSVTDDVLFLCWEWLTWLHLCREELSQPLYIYIYIGKRNSFFKKKFSFLILVYFVMLFFKSRDVLGDIHWRASKCKFNTQHAIIFRWWWFICLICHGTMME